jgi:hypothetical protein
MSVIRVGSSKKFADNWDSIFGAKKKGAAATPKTKKAAATKGTKKKGASKEAKKKA